MKGNLDFDLLKTTNDLCSIVSILDARVNDKRFERVNECAKLMAARHDFDI